MTFDTEKPVAILGSGVMGAQLAALFANAKMDVYLFDLKDSKSNVNLSSKAIKNLGKLKPEPLALNNLANNIKSCNYEDDLQLLSNCSLVIEAVAENMSIKKELLQSVASHISEDCWITSNTSGLSVNELSKNIPLSFQDKFCGTHFFNPPRYLPLVEIIYTDKTDRDAAENLINFFISQLGKNIVVAPDRPNFIANKVAIFSMISTIQNALKFDIELEIVDQLTGKPLSRAKSATLRTADIVGLDILSNAAKTSSSDQQDPWRHEIKMPVFIQQLISEGSLGQKTGKGIYEKRSDGIYVFDIKTNMYRASDRKAPKPLIDLLESKDYKKIFTELSTSDDKYYQFLWSCFVDLFTYASWACESLETTTKSVDMALKLGFGWEDAPFEIWQQARIQFIADLVNTALSKNSSITSLSKWVLNTKHFYEGDKSYNPSKGKFESHTTFSAETKQLDPIKIYTEQPLTGKVIFKSNAATVWTTGDGILILSLKTKLATIGREALEAFNKAIDIAEKDYNALVIWQQDCQHFGAGANLTELAEQYFISGISSVETTIKDFQQASLRLKYSKIPTVAAVRGFALGGSCEIMMHCNRRVVAQNSFIGLVEVGVGIIPAAAGSKEMAVKALKSNDPFKNLAKNYRTLALGQLATSAQQALEMGFLDVCDIITAHQDEILYIAKQQAHALAESNFKAPKKVKITALGIPAVANMELEIANMKAGEYVTDHDCYIATKLANVMCGGNIDQGVVVDENWLLKLEREAFLELVQTDKSQARIEHMLKTGKRLRN